VPKPLLVHWSLWNQNRVPTETFEGFHKSVVPEHALFVPMTEPIPYNILHAIFFFILYVYLDFESNVDISGDDGGSPLKNFAEVIGKSNPDFSLHTLWVMKRKHGPGPWRPAFWIRSSDLTPSFRGFFRILFSNLFPLALSRSGSRPLRMFTD